MTSHEPHQRGPTPPRRWRPGVAFVGAAVVAILLLVVWQLFLASGADRAVPLPRTPAAPLAPPR